MNTAGEEGDYVGRAWMETRRTLLKIAVETLGRASVARQLNVPVVLLDDWIEGYPPVPDWKLPALLELIDTGLSGSRLEGAA
jgi:hypothetical protein